MTYAENYSILSQAFDALDEKKDIENIEFRNFSFESSTYPILPGAKHHFCDSHQEHFSGTEPIYNDIGTIDNGLHIEDVYVEENKKFNYQVLVPKGTRKIKKITLFFHGFNEKTWYKYLPWAKMLCEKTQSAVVLFPIAFHMQRAPHYWSEKRAMFILSEKRKKRYPNIVNTTLSNVAISMRLHAMPQRFIWSGLQTYYDVIQFLESSKKGEHELISPDFQFNMFAYSVGGLLAQILKLSNYKGYFDQAKLGLFCSGAVFNRLSPVSKFILDSEANVALYSFLIEHLDKIMKKSPRLDHYINAKGKHMEGTVFHAMLDYQKMTTLRESLLQKYENDIYAICLKQDRIIPSFEIINTLQGAYRTINIRVDEIDFEYPYTHENPFPLTPALEKQVDLQFRNIFEKMGAFLNT